MRVYEKPCESSYWLILLMFHKNRSICLYWTTLSGFVCCHLNEDLFTLYKNINTKMWKELKISEQTYFIYCDFEENTRDITFMLYDFKIIWCQSVAFEDAKHKVKVKTFKHTYFHIQSAFTKMQVLSVETTRQQTVTYILCQSRWNRHLLNLKQYVKNICMYIRT